MDKSYSTSQIVDVTFKLFSETEAKQLSVLPVTSVQTFDPLGHPLNNSLADTALGPLKRSDFCKTCGLTDQECLGHFGTIQLPLPVFNPFLMKQVSQILKMFCFQCHHLLFTSFNLEIYMAQLRSLDLDMDYILDDIWQYANEISQSTKGIDWNSYEGKLFLRSKLNQLINSECQKTMQKNQSDESVATLESVEIVNSKNVVEKKQLLFKDMFGCKMIKPVRVCFHCNSKKRGLNVINKSLIIMTTGAQKTLMKNASDPFKTDKGENDDQPEMMEMKGKSYLTPSQARDHLRKLWSNENETLIRLFPFLNIDFDSNDGGKLPPMSDQSCPMDVFFWQTIIVPPNRFRPLRHVNGRSFEHYQTAALSELMLVAQTLEMALQNAKKNNRGDVIARFHHQWQRMQILCNRIYDSQMDNLPDNKSVGVKQILEKKEGLMRKNMMGKRVNFAARSVISPDPYIMADEIGVPVIFATKLSYPQPVTHWNVKQLRDMIINGPNQHPGALSITYEDGYTVRLKPDDLAQRRSIAATIHPSPFNHYGLNGVKIVNRHLVSGDVLLLNRQPTLHKPSIMAHKARVLPKEKTLRLHYANCKSYNADFDGDEMNAHFPQSELARAEAYNIASVNYQFLVPKDGSPLSGLIQDHIVAGVLLSTRGKFFKQNDYQELVYGAVSFMNKPIKYLPPSILKPECLWSGKQIISTLLLNLIPSDKPLPTFEIENKISPKYLIVEKPRPCTMGRDLAAKDMCESQVIFRHGELLCGIMDKVSFGATKNGLIHVCYELYGGDIHSKLLTAIARLCTNYLQTHHGFTLGIKDILVKPKPDLKRKKLIKQSKTIGLKVVMDAFAIDAQVHGTDIETVVREELQKAHVARTDLLMKQLDAAYKAETDQICNQITPICIPNGLLKTFPQNNLQMMIQSGAKGASANATQISCLLGQIELEGRRIPWMMSGRTLPSFRPFETEPRAGGFVTGRFLSGIRPQEFFFHCMAGREGLIDTAVKTSRSGYLQRCLIKHLEGLIVNYDLTVRDSEGSVIQWLYGEDGLDISKSQSLKKPFFPTIFNNQEALKPKMDEIQKLKSMLDPTFPTQMKKTKKLIKSIETIDWKRRNENTSPFLRFECQQTRRKPELKKADLTKMWFDLSMEKRQNYLNKIVKPLDPVIPKYRPDLNMGAISESLDKIIDEYLQKDLKHCSANILEEFRKILDIRYMRSLCAPGEAVGLLAAQSIGEPSTQMTLNTFHFAGRGEMNVTLGVPRLRELLMTASSNISTPSMSIPFRTDIDIDPVNMDEEAEKVRLKLNAVRLKHVLEQVVVQEMIEIKSSNIAFGDKSRVYEIQFYFLPKSYYKQRFFTNSSKILHFFEAHFVRQFVDALNRQIRLLTKSYGLFDTKIGQRSVSGRSRKKDLMDGDEEEAAAMANKNSDGDADANPDDNYNNSKKQMLADDDEDEDFDDYDVDEGEGDTTAMRQRSRINQEQEYEEPDEEEVEMEDDDLNNDDGDGDVDNQQTGLGTKIKQELLDDEPDEQLAVVAESGKEQKHSTSKKMKISEVNADERKKRVINRAPGTIIDYDFDTKRELWCKLRLKFPLIATKLDFKTIIEEEANKAFVHRVGRIDRAFLIKDDEAAQRDDPFCKLIQTEGVSVPQVVEFERLLDLNRIYTNDMHAIARTYGIEAARAALIREIKNVFAVYAISLDGRHLSLIADHMTFTGTIKGMNRGAMDGVSPLQAMTFETTTNFLKNSLLLGLKDDLRSPSSRIVIGRPTIVGTGLFETRLDPKIVDDLTKSSLGQQHISTAIRLSGKAGGQSSFLSSTMGTSFIGGGDVSENRKTAKRKSDSLGDGGEFEGEVPEQNQPNLVKEEPVSDVEEENSVQTEIPKRSSNKRIKLEFD